MVYEVKGVLELSQKNIQTLRSRCQEFVLKSACIEALKNEYVVPVLQYYSGQNITIETDPVKIAWNLLRQGGLACALLNAFRANTIRTIHPMSKEVSEDAFRNKPSQENVAAFIAACRDDLYMTEEQVFSPKELFKDDTNALNKALGMCDTFFARMRRVQRVDFDSRIKSLRESDPLFAQLAAAAESSAAPFDQSSVRENRLRAIGEILTSERQYVGDLEKLQHYAEELRMDQIIPPEIHAAIFSNLDQLIDFQRRFLLTVEGCISGPVLTDLQASYRAGIGRLFIEHEHAFSVYETFCGNHRRSLQTVEMEKNRLRSKEALMNPEGVVQSFLIKPIQRICRYPLLIREIIKKSSNEAPDLPELETALATMKRVTDIVNERQRQEENAAISAEFKTAIMDWKVGSVRIDKDLLGDLLLSEKATIIQRDTEKEMQLYLFEKVLLICREGKTLLKSSKKGWVLRGAIYSKQLISIINPDPTTVRIAFRSADAKENIFIKFLNTEKAQQWARILGSLVVVTRPATIEAVAISESRSRRRSIISLLKAPPVGPEAVALDEAVLIPRESNAIRLKVLYGEQMYISIQREIDSLSALKQIALQKIQSDSNLCVKECMDWPLDQMRVKYRDADKDWINVCSDDDLDIAIADSNNALTIQLVRIKPKPNNLVPNNIQVNSQQAEKVSQTQSQ